MRPKQENIVVERKDNSLASKVRSYLSDLRTTFKNPNFRKRSKYATYWKHLSIKENQILYESFYGRGMYDNPYALFLALLEDPRAKKMKHIWVLDNLNDHQALIEEYEQYPNVSFVELYSKEYLKSLCSVKYLINNNTFPTYFTKKKGQIYINTWHGIPLKTLGYDMPNGKTMSHNVVRNFLHADYLISTSPAVTDLIYCKAHKLEGLWGGKIIEEGYPRLDLTFRFSREEVFANLKQYGVKVVPNKKIILYAPTWRGENHNKVDIDVDEYYSFKEQLEKLIDTSEYQILIKPHHLIYESCKDALSEAFFVPATIDTNVLLSVADLLITDYSSIYFDYLVTGRPVLFYISDLENYIQQRGIYKTIDQLPGPTAENIDKLASLINNLETVVALYREAYEREYTWSGAVADGGISRRIVDGIFFKNVKNCAMRHLPKLGKKKVFISVDALRVNGISTSFLSLLSNIDYDRYDVSVMVKKSPEKEGQKRIEQIPQEVRVLYRNSTLNLTRWEVICHQYRMNFGMKRYHYPEYQREFLRCYGGVAFDYLIDFTGYSRLFSLLLLQSPTGKTAIWMHNDMYGEYKLKFPYLETVFKMYSKFDYLISCSQEIMEVNRTNLSDRYSIPSEKFRYAKNCLNVSKLKEAPLFTSLIWYGDKRQILVNESTYYGRTTARLVPYIPEQDEVGNKNFRFVTVGRMSPEKNQLNLIEAFDKLHQEIPNTVLYIVGDGPLRDETRKLIRSVPSKNAIILTYRIPNPFVVMNHCDCFVLPSLHEGQGLAVFEARALHMPIIVSNFDCVDSVSLENGQLVIGTEVEDIYEGLKAFTEGRVPSNYEFDMVKYNEEAYQEFLIAIGERAGGGALQ